MQKIKERYIFTRGSELHLDVIYDIQGLCGGDWWEPIEDAIDDIVITKNITIVITANIHQPTEGE